MGLLGDVPGKGGGGGLVVVMGGKAADVLGRKYLVRVWPVGWCDRAISETVACNLMYMVYGNILEACSAK